MPERIREMKPEIGRGTMRNRQRLMIELLALLLTVITLALGGLMYFSNLKSTRQNLIGVELADFIYNTDYSTKFGKRIETFYGMQEDLLELRDSIDDVDQLHILSAENQLLFSTEPAMLPERAYSMPAGNNMSDRNHLYCMYTVGADARILTVSGISDIQREMGGYLLKLVGIATAGFLLVLLLIHLVWRMIPEGKRAYRIAAAVSLLWIAAFSAMTGVDAYRDYAGSSRELCECIGESVQADIARVEALGVARKDFYEVEAYLQRYTYLIPEVEKLSLGEDDEISYEMSADYRRKMGLDYVLQAVLLLTFSLLILAEYQFFVTNTGTLTEGQNGTV